MPTNPLQSNIPVTETKREHFHTISNPDSGYTDFAEDDRGVKHRHKLSTGCRRCDRTRKNTVYRGKWGTTYNRGHFHHFEPEDIQRYTGRTL